MDKKPPAPLPQEGRGKEKRSKEPQLTAHTTEVRTINNHLPPAGRLRWFLPAWKEITSDARILDMVQHCHIEFVENPQQNYPVNPIRFNSQEIEIIDNEIQKLLQKGVLEKAEPSEHQFISNIFLRKKRNGSYRMILNLKGLNESIEYVHFKMESLTCAVQLMKQNCFMGSIDLTDAYYTVPVAQEHRKYLRFQWKNILYEYTCLPNGLASAPRYFTKLLKPVCSTLRSKGYLNVGYIDDFYVQGSSAAECKNNIEATRKLFESLGFIISLEKSVLNPVQRIVFLGFILDSLNMRVYLTPEKAEKTVLACKHLLVKKCITIREVSKVIGLLVSSLPGVQHGPLFYRNIEIDKNYALKTNHGCFESEMTLSSESKADLQWWMTSLPTAYKTILPNNPDIELTTDASKMGWGAVCIGQSAQGRWSVLERNRHINELEILAVHFGLSSFMTELKGKHVCVKSDNTTTVCYINSMGGTKSTECNALTKSIWLLCIENDIWLTACHLPGKLNVDADHNSRHFNDKTEWHLRPDIFSKVTHVLGRPEIDMFASRLNYQLKNYVSWKPDPGASHINAFSMCWSNMYLYLFPPFCLISRCLQKLQEDQSTALMIAPIWPTQFWWPQLLSLLVAQPIILPQHQDLLTMPHSGAHHPLKNRLKMMACLVSSDTSKQMDYQNKLLTCSWNHGEAPQRSNMPVTSTNGPHFVLKNKLITFVHL